MYVKKFDISPGDRVRVTMPAQESFPAGWAEGKVISATFYDEEGWYIEMDKDNVSPGWDTGYGYVRQLDDRADIELLTSEVVAPLYPGHIMERVRQHLGLEPYDTSRDAEINTMSRDTVFDHCLEWEGMMGYGHQMRGWMHDIYGVDLS